MWHKRWRLVGENSCAVTPNEFPWLVISMFAAHPLMLECWKLRGTISLTLNSKQGFAATSLVLACTQHANILSWRRIIKAAEVTLCFPPLSKQGWPFPAFIDSMFIDHQSRAGGHQLNHKEQKDQFGILPELMLSISSKTNIFFSVLAPCFSRKKNIF